MGLDIGPASAEPVRAQLADARTVFWNGPMGVFEMAPYAEGTRGGRRRRSPAVDGLSVVGGGDSAAAVRVLGLDERFGHISTGGGASLELLEGKTLPGLAVLEQASPRSDRHPTPWTDGPPTTRTPLMAGNWKMNLDHLEATAPGAEAGLDAATTRKHDYAAVEVAVLPPFTDLRSRADAGRRRPAAPCVYGGAGPAPRTTPAPTPARSPVAMLAALGCTYVVRRPQRAARAPRRGRRHWWPPRSPAAFRHGLVPIVCVGEGLEVREAGEHVALHAGPARRLARRVSTAEQVAGIVVAYEPVWAIGTGEVATPDDAQEVCAPIRARVGELHGDAVAAGVRVLYGGSVKPSNVAGDHGQARRRRRARRRGEPRPGGLRRRSAIPGAPDRVTILDCAGRRPPRPSLSVPCQPATTYDGETPP